MGTNIRPEVSKKKEYWIPKHRYYELKHFVMQYPDWVDFMKENESSLVTTPPTYSDKVQLGAVSDPTWQSVNKRALYFRNVDMVNRAAEDTDPILGKVILQNVINETPFKEWSDTATLASRDHYYILYRKFFWLLDRYRDM